MNKRSYKEGLDKLKQRMDSFEGNELDRKVNALKTGLKNLKSDDLSLLIREGKEGFEKRKKILEANKEDISFYAIDAKKKEDKMTVEKTKKTSSSTKKTGKNRKVSSKNNTKNNLKDSEPKNTSTEIRTLGVGETIISEEKIKILNNSVEQLHKAIRNLTKIISNATTELKEEKGEEEKIEEVIKQNKKIISKMEKLFPEEENKEESSKQDDDISQLRERNKNAPTPKMPMNEPGEIKKNKAPKPPEDDSSNIPYLKLKKGNKYDL